MSVVTSLLKPTVRSRSSARGSTPNVVRRETHAPDFVVLVAVVALTAIGVLVVYSSSAMQSYAGSANSFAVVGPQVVWGALGLIAMMVMTRVDYRRLRMLSVPLYILAVVLRRFSYPVAAGLLVGIIGAAALSQILRRELYGVSSLDPLAYLAAMAVFVVTVVVAALLPARRALRIDPMRALRYE